MPGGGTPQIAVKSSFNSSDARNCAVINGLSQKKPETVIPLTQVGSCGGVEAELKTHVQAVRRRRLSGRCCLVTLHFKLFIKWL